MPGKAPNSPDCAPQSVWYAIAAGVVYADPRTTDDLLLHASLCDKCGESLKIALTVLYSPERTEETQWLSRVAEPTHRQPAWFRVWTPALASAALVLLSISGYEMWRIRRLPFPEMTKAFSERRNLALRLPAAIYAPLAQERGPAGAKPSQLLEAELKIRRKEESGSMPAEWLRAAGQLALVESDYKTAIEKLSSARDLAPDSADVLITLAAAYSRRAEVEQQPSDDTRANELLSEVLKNDPRNTAALFDRALVCERLSLFAEAIHLWDQFLSIEKTGGWSDEARKKREEIAKRLSRLEDPAWDIAAQQLPEERMERLLSQSSSFASLRANPEARELAVEMAEVHHDPWFGQLLSQPASDQDFRVLAEMASLRRRIGAGGYDHVLPQISRLLLQPMPPSWAAWARLEELFRESHQAPANCLATVAAALPIAEKNQYRWLQTQIVLERSTCEIMANRLEAADASTDEATALATKYAFPVALVRSHGFLTSHLVNEGRYREAIQIAQQNLQTIEAGNMPRLRSMQFYNDMMRSAERMERWWTAEEAAEAAARVAHLTAATTNELVLNSTAAEDAVHSGDYATASRRYELARQLQRPASPGERLNGSSLSAALSLAEARQDREALNALEAPVQLQGNPFFRIPFLLSLASLDDRDGDQVSAERHTGEAIDWLARNHATDTLAQSRWRETLSHAYRLRVSLLLKRGDFQGAYRAWQEYLNQDEIQLGLESATLPAPPAGTLRITVARLPDRYAMWWEADGEVRFTMLPETAAEIDRISHRLRLLCREPSSSLEDIDAMERRLEALFREPLAKAVTRAKRIEVQLDGALAGSPFHMLRLAEGQPLGVYRPVAYRISLRPSKPLSIAPSEKALVVAGSTLAPATRASYAPLDGLENEAIDIARHFRNASLLTSANATPLAVISAWQGSNLFQFSGHSIARPEGTALLLAPDATHQTGTWRVEKSNGWAPQFAVLAACATADDEEFESVAPRNLAHAFLIAGVHGVLAAQWNLQSSTTTDLLSDFYRTTGSAADVTEALRHAVADVREKHVHPYYWAPFAVYI